MMAKCKGCGKSSSWMSMYESGLCSDCQESAQRERESEQREREREAIILAEREKLLAEELELRVSSMMLTTETAHNLPVAERLGIVAAEVVIGMHIFRDIGAAFRDVFGGRSQTMQKGLKEAREAALAELRVDAAKLGADAVVAIDLDYSEISGGGKSMLFLVASGTAVRLSS